MFLSEVRPGGGVLWSRFLWWGVDPRPESAAPNMYNTKAIYSDDVAIKLVMGFGITTVVLSIVVDCCELEWIVNIAIFVGGKHKQIDHSIILRQWFCCLIGEAGKPSL